MDLSVKYTFLEVDDHEAALAFYRDALGFEVRQDVAMEGARWLTVGPASQPELAPEHMCMSLRGVQRPGARTVTSALRGAIRDDHQIRQDFLALTTDSP